MHLIKMAIEPTLFGLCLVGADLHWSGRFWILKNSTFRLDFVNMILKLISNSSELSNYFLLRKTI
jgi:hypothetical protein